MSIIVLIWTLLFGHTAAYQTQVNAGINFPGTSCGFEFYGAPGDPGMFCGGE